MKNIIHFLVDWSTKLTHILSQLSHVPNCLNCLSIHHFNINFYTQLHKIAFTSFLAKIHQENHKANS